MDHINASREKYGGKCGNMGKNRGNMGEIWGKMWNYERMWKYPGNMGAILFDNMYTNQCVKLDLSKSTLLSRAKQVRGSSATSMSIKFMGIST